MVNISRFSLVRFLANRNIENFEKSVDFLNAADTDFVSDLIAKLKFEVYLQADEIIREGSVGSHMYFINSGTVQVTTKNGMKPRYLSGRPALVFCGPIFDGLLT